MDSIVGGERFRQEVVFLHHLMEHFVQFNSRFQITRHHLEARPKGQQGIHVILRRTVGLMHVDIDHGHALLHVGHDRRVMILESREIIVVLLSQQNISFEEILVVRINASTDA